MEKRELQSLYKKHKREQRIEQRGKHNEMPSLEQVAGLELSIANVRDKALDLLRAFEEAQVDRSHDVPDLMKAFTRVAEDKERGDKDSGGSDDRSNASSPKSQSLRNRKRDDNFDRER